MLYYVLQHKKRTNNSTFNNSSLRLRRKLCSHLRVFDVHYNRTNALPTPYELMLFFTKR